MTKMTYKQRAALKQLRASEEHRRMFETPSMEEERRAASIVMIVAFFFAVGFAGVFAAMFFWEVIMTTLAEIIVAVFSIFQTYAGG